MTSHYEILVCKKDTTDVVRTVFGTEAAARIAFRLAEAPAAIVRVEVIEEK